MGRERGRCLSFLRCVIGCWVLLVVAVRELIGHGHDGEGAVLLDAVALLIPAAVDQAVLLTLQEGLVQDVMLIPTVEVERLMEREREREKKRERERERES